MSKSKTETFLDQLSLHHSDIAGACCSQSDQEYHLCMTVSLRAAARVLVSRGTGSPRCVAAMLLVQQLTDAFAAHFLTL